MMGVMAIMVVTGLKSISVLIHSRVATQHSYVT